MFVMSDNRQFAILLTLSILIIWILILYNLACDPTPFAFFIGFVITFLVSMPVYGTDKHTICVIISITSNYLWLSLYIFMMVNNSWCHLHEYWNKILCTGLVSLVVTLIM